MDDTEPAHDDQPIVPETRADLLEMPTEAFDPYATVAPAPGEMPEAGAKFGGDRFRIVRPLARGGLGEVFVAHDGELNREVALKEIQDRFADHLASRLRFLYEARVTGRLEHPGIVPIYGMGESPDGRPYYAMRLIRGETLHDAIARFRKECERTEFGPGERVLELRRLLGRFVEVCRTMHYAHGQGVLHRDIKPANVMLGAHGEAIVVDWGLAKILGSGEAPDTVRPGDAPKTLADDGSMTQAGTSLGTPSYMSPEQAAGDLARLGPASDIYSLGAILFCLLTGRAPFEGRELAPLLDRVMRGEFPRPRKLDRRTPKVLEAICLKAMALRPEDRYPDAGQLANDVERWMAGEPTSARREIFPQKIWRWARRRPDLAFYITILAGADVLYLGGLVEPLIARYGGDVRLYLGLVIFAAMAIILIPFFAIVISQFPLALFAAIGAIIGWFRGNVREGLHRGAALGIKTGMVAGLIITLGILVMTARGVFDQILPEMPSGANLARPATGSDLEKHQGTWVIVSDEHDGRPIPAHEFGGETRTIRGAEVTRFQGGVTLKSSLSLNPLIDPKQYDTELLEGQLQGMVIRGIYKFEGDTLVTCWSNPGRLRPKSFATTPDSGLRLTTWRRARP